MRAPAPAASSDWSTGVASLIRLDNDVAAESPPFFRCVASARRNGPVSFGCRVVWPRAGGCIDKNVTGNQYESRCRRGRTARAVSTKTTLCTVHTLKLFFISY